MKKTLSNTVFLALFLLSVGCDQAAPVSKKEASSSSKIQFTNAWIRPTPPNTNVAAAYGEIVNNTTTVQRLVAATSPMFSSIEFHSSTDENGLASMQRYDRIEIANGETFSFKPGSYHFMLFNPEIPLKEHSKVWIQLKFASGNTVEQYVNVAFGPNQ